MGKYYGHFKNIYKNQKWNTTQQIDVQNIIKNTQFRLKKNTKQTTYVKYNIGNLSPSLPFLESCISYTSCGS